MDGSFTVKKTTAMDHHGGFFIEMADPVLIS